MLSNIINSPHYENGILDVCGTVPVDKKKKPPVYNVQCKSAESCLETVCSCGEKNLIYSIYY